MWRITAKGGYHQDSLCTSQWVNLNALCAYKMRTIGVMQLKLWNVAILRMTFHVK